MEARMAEKKSASNGGYSDVKSILNDIQGHHIPDYEGLGAFWLDHETFLKATLYGHRLIAEAPDTLADDGDPGKESADSCCGSADDTSQSQDNSAGCWPSGGSRGRQFRSAAVKDRSRSNNSALIQGLKGHAPFDGSVFPRLLWGSTRPATASEISLIADWIDDGCPSDEQAAAASISGAKQRSLASGRELSRLQSLATGELKHERSSLPTNRSQALQNGLKVRKEIHSLTETELKRFREAIACMKSYDAYFQDERSFAFWGRMHANSCQHGWEQFLPWHRLYLYFFEQMLQDFDENITLPYWAWSDYADVNRGTFNTNKLDQGILPDRYGCWLDSTGLSALEASGLFSEEQLNRLAKMSKDGTVYQSSNRFLKAAGIDFGVERNRDGQAQWTPAVRAVYDELARINPLWTPKRWPGAFGGPTSYPTPQDIERIMQTTNFPDFGGGPEHDHHFGYLEQVHNGMHNFSGGTNPNYPNPGNSKWIKIYRELGITADPQSLENPPAGLMVDARVTAFDPIFWAHHGNVDRIWTEWQTRHPHANPVALDAVLAPWALTVKETLNASSFGYEYMRNSYHYHTSSDVGMARFNSQKAGVSARTLENFQKAQVRLHRVQHANLPSAIMRIYLNDDSADHTTKIQDNDHFVGEIHTFHGTCYGGPGHCDLPLEKTRRFDQRGLHHNEPRNYRIDATDTVNRMLSRGENDISVHIVAIGLDGQPLDNALYLDGVSLNFMD